MNAYETAAKYLAIIQKAGARHSAKDTDLVQQMHDRACELGAKCKCAEMTTHPMLKGALVLRHPGHGNQKVHGNRFGGFEVTKESLRRLKGDKEATAKYKEGARKRGASAKESGLQGQINAKWAERDTLQGTIDAGNLKPKYRKERAQKVAALDREISELKYRKGQELIRMGVVKPGAFIKQRGTSATGIVTGRGTMKVGKQTIPVFKVRMPSGGRSVIPFRDTDIVSL